MAHTAKAFRIKPQVQETVFDRCRDGFEYELGLVGQLADALDIIKKLPGDVASNFGIAEDVRTLVNPMINCGMRLFDLVSERIRSIAPSFESAGAEDRCLKEAAQHIESIREQFRTKPELCNLPPKVKSTIQQIYDGIVALPEEGQRCAEGKTGAKSGSHRKNSSHSALHPLEDAGHDGWGEAVVAPSNQFRGKRSLQIKDMERLQIVGTHGKEDHLPLLILSNGLYVHPTKLVHVEKVTRDGHVTLGGRWGREEVKRLLHGEFPRDVLMCQYDNPNQPGDIVIRLILPSHIEGHR